MTTKIAINGFGRIGRIIARNLFTSPQLKNKIQLVAVNDLGAPSELAFSFQYDSTHGKFPTRVEATDDSLTIDGQKITCLKISNPAELPWKKLGIDVVLECTGRFTDKESAAVHLKNGAKKVIISAPAKGVDLTVVMGVNHNKYESQNHHVLSNASCTTNCLAPIAHVIHSKWGIQQGYMTTIHSFTSDQRILDNLHKDPRRARTASTNMIPTTTGAAKAVGEVIPELKGRLDGISIRVPTPNVSLTDLVATVAKPLTRDELNRALQEASETTLKGILGFSKEPLVSSDFNGSPLSSIVDAECTSVMSGPFGNTIKVCSWYDNETGFSCRMLDLVDYIGAKL
jgi:glyceraldehyde 3-phosphate dehydrogenase